MCVCVSPAPLAVKASASWRRKDDRQAGSRRKGGEGFCDMSKMLMLVFGIVFNMSVVSEVCDKSDTKDKDK